VSRVSTRVLAFVSAITTRWRRGAYFRLPAIDFVSRRAVRLLDLSRRLTVSVALHERHTSIRSITTLAATMMPERRATPGAIATRDRPSAATAPSTIAGATARRPVDAVGTAMSTLTASRTIVRPEILRRVTEISTVPTSASPSLGSVGPRQRATHSPRGMRHGVAGPTSTPTSRRDHFADVPVAVRPVRTSMSLSAAPSAPIPIASRPQQPREVPALTTPRRFVPTAERGSRSAPIEKLRRDPDTVLHIDRPTPAVNRTTRIEQSAAPIPFDRPRLSSAAAAAAAHDSVRREVHEIVSKRTARPAGALDATELERAIEARLDQRLDRKISARIKASLHAEPEISRAITDRVYGALYDRMILEKERRG
jgi:hypothetical protein